MSFTRLARRWAPAPLIAGVLVLAATTRSPAATFHIASGDVAGLVAAINTANGNGEADTINLAAGTYTLMAGGLPAITSEIEIIGAGAATTTVERAVAAPHFNIFTVAFSADARIEGVTVHRGRGGVLNGGNLKIVDSILSDNSFALSTGNEVEIEDSIITGSTGNGIQGGATITIRGSQIVSNTLAAIDMSPGGLLRLVDTLIQGNLVGISGTTGFPDRSLFLQVLRSTIDGQAQAGIAFGTFYDTAAARAIVTDSTISSNAGGGIRILYEEQTELVVRRSTLSGNSTTTNGGAIYVEGASIAPGGLAQVTIDSSTISGNSAALSGGAIYLADGLRLGRRIRVVRSTITGNTADSDSNGSGNGGGIVTPTPVVDLEDSILAGNDDTGGEAPDCEGALTSRGHNLLGTATGCAMVLGSTDVSGAPLLGALAANGGLTSTHLPLPGSPARDAADPARCGAPDQRGLERPVDGDGDTVDECDIGATEAGAAMPVTYISDHFLCYDTKVAIGTPALPALSGVVLGDAFESKLSDVKKSRALCTPASKNAEGILDEETHLHSREIKATAGETPHFRQLGLRFATQLGMFSIDTIKPERLLVPTSKGIGAPPPAPNPLLHDVDRYKCYKARRSPGTPALPRGATALSVMLENQFTDGTSFTLSKLTRLCTPVDMSGLGIENPTAHLVCFQARTLLPLLTGGSEPTFSDLFSTSEFGTEELVTKRAYELCLPGVLLP